MLMFAVIAILYAAPYLSTLTARMRAGYGIKRSLKAWMSDATTKKPTMTAVDERFNVLCKLTDPTSVDRYFDVSNGFVVREASSVGLMAYREERLQTQRGVIGKFEVGKKLSNESAAAEIEVSKTHFDHVSSMLPEILSEESNIPNRNTPAGWIRLIAWSFNELTIVSEIESEEFSKIQWDRLSSLLIYGGEGFERVKGNGAILIRYLLARRALHPVLSALDLTHNFMDAKATLYEVEDLPALVSIAPLLETSVDDLEAKVREAADAISPSLYRFSENMYAQIGLAHTKIEMWQAINKFTALATYLQRYATLGYGHADKCSGMGAYMTSRRIKENEKADVNCPAFFSFVSDTARKLIPVPFDREEKQIALMKATSSGPGYAAKVYGQKARGAKRKIFRVGDKDVQANALTLKIKPLFYALAAPLLNLVVFSMMFGTVLCPGGIGERSDIEKWVRFIYLMPMTILFLQAYVREALLKFEYSMPNIFINKSSRGTVGNTDTIYEMARAAVTSSPKLGVRLLTDELVRPPYAISECGMDTWTLMFMFDFPKWDQHLRRILGIWIDMARSKAAPGVFFHATDEERAAFATVYDNYLREQAVFEVKDGDSDRFIMYVGSSTSGDLWTTPLNSFIHDQLQRFLGRVFSLYRQGGDWTSQLQPIPQFIQVPTYSFIDAEITETRQVFGDDGILMGYLRGMSTLSRSDAIKSLEKLSELVQFTMNIAGFGLAKEDVSSSFYYASMLNVYFYHSYLSRRFRTSLESEKHARPKPHEFVGSFEGLLVSGQSIASYIVLMASMVLRAAPKASRGEKLVIPPGSYLAPVPDNSFVTMIPYLYPHFTIFQARGFMSGTTFTRVKVSDKSRELSEKLYSSVSTGTVSLAGRRFPEKQVSTMLSETFDYLAGRSPSRDPRKTLDPKTQELFSSEKDFRNVSFVESVGRSFRKFLWESASTSDVIGRYVRQANVSEVEISKYEMPSKTVVDIGFDSSIFVSDNVSMLLTAEKGTISLHTRSTQPGKTNSFVRVSSWDLHFPVMMGVADVYFGLECIFGVTQKPTDHKDDSRLSTGRFSMDPLTAEAILKVLARSSDLASKNGSLDPGALKKSALLWMGFNESEAVDILGKPELFLRERLIFLNDTVSRWGATTRVPELPLSRHHIEPVMRELFFSPDITFGEKDSNSTESKRMMGNIFYDVSSALLFNDVTTTLFQHLTLSGGSLSTLLYSDTRVVLGHSWGVSIKARV